MSVTAGVFDAVKDMLSGKLGKTKVSRYRPGRAPEWADNVEEDSVDNALGKTYPAHKAGSDSRLRRLKDCRRTDNREKAIAEHILFRQAEGVKEENIGEVELKPEEENEYALEVNRMKTREKLLSQMQQEDASPVFQEEESEYEECDSGDDELVDSLMVCPVFVAKEKRLTISLHERIDAMDQSLTETEKRRVTEMKAETKKMVVEEVKKDENIQKSMDFGGDVDTDDEVNAADEYKAWMTREVPRIRRDRETKEEVKVRERILEWDRKNLRPAKRKLRFMQVCYHKGAFFQSGVDDPTGTVEADDIYLCDFCAPTGEDKMDKTILPKVMQVKRFGRSGRTKWTHLVNEDTTDWNSSWTYSDSLPEKHVSKMAGMKAIVKRSRKLDTQDPGIQ